MFVVVHVITLSHFYFPINFFISTLWFITYLRLWFIALENAVMNHSISLIFSESSFCNNFELVCLWSFISLQYLTFNHHINVFYFEAMIPTIGSAMIHSALNYWYESYHLVEFQLISFGIISIWCVCCGSGRYKSHLLPPYQILFRCYDS